MSNITSYAELQSRLRSWLGNNSSEGFETALQTAVTLAESDMNYGFLQPDMRTAFRGLRVPEMITRVSFQANEKYEVLPADFLEAVAVYLLNTETGDETPLSAIREDRAGLLDGRKGPTRHYCVVGNQIRLSPRPQAETGVRLIYYANVQPLENAQSCTAVLRSYPGIYLYGSLAHMEGWLENDSRIATWKALFHSQMKAANTAASYRAGPYAAA